MIKATLIGCFRMDCHLTTNQLMNWVWLDEWALEIDIICLDRTVHSKWIAFANCLLLMTTIDVWIWSGLLRMEWIDDVDEPIIEEEEVDFPAVIDFLLDCESPDFDFVWVPRPCFWIPFVSSLTVLTPSRIFLSNLKESLTSALSTLLLITQERNRLLDLFEYISYD
jgi:hypothetical protein